MTSHVSRAASDHPRVYHIGLLVRGSTLVVQARSTVDELSCEIWKYFGPRLTTKKHLRANADALIDLVARNTGRRFTRVIVE